MDLAVTNAFDDSVSILAGNCNGTYSREEIEDVGDSPWHIIAVDIDDDTDPDLVVANPGSGNVRVLRNDGAGQFSLDPPVATGAGAHWIAVEDYDSDGHVDLAVANFFGATITVLWNDGSGLFSSSNQLATNGANPYALATSDFDGDQRADLMLTSQDDQKVDVFMNLGGRNFSNPTTIMMGSPGDQLTSVVLAKLDNDQHVDAAVANVTAGLIYVLYGNGDGTFAVGPSLSGSSAHDLAIGDIDGNGTSDLVVACFQPTNQLAYLLNDGFGNFAPPVYLPGGSQPVFAKTADLDGDADQDVVTVNYGGNNISIYYNLCISADTDSDGVYDFCDNCPTIANPDQANPIAFTGFMPPISGADATGGSFADPLRAFRLGSTIPVKFGSSGISGKGVSDFEEEVVIVAESVGHSLDDFDLVVDPFQEAGVQGIAAVGDDAV